MDSNEDQTFNAAHIKMFPDMALLLKNELQKMDRKSRKNEEAILQLRNTMADLGRRMEERNAIPSGSTTWETTYELALRQLMIDKNESPRIMYDNIAEVSSIPRTRQHSEILVTFRDAAMKDHVLSHVRNLATYVDKEGNPMAGVRLQIPPFLSRTHRNLDAYGFYLKQKYGRSTR